MYVNMFSQTFEISRWKNNILMFSVFENMNIIFLYFYVFFSTCIWEIRSQMKGLKGWLISKSALYFQTEMLFLISILSYLIIHSTHPFDYASYLKELYGTYILLPLLASVWRWYLKSTNTRFAIAFSKGLSNENIPMALFSPSIFTRTLIRSLCHIPDMSDDKAWSVAQLFLGLKPLMRRWSRNTQALLMLGCGSVLWVWVNL